MYKKKKKGKLATKSRLNHKGKSHSNVEFITKTDLKTRQTHDMASETRPLFEWHRSKRAPWNLDS